MQRAEAPSSGHAMPLVSIVMPSWNQARFIESAIGSVLGQSYGRLELLVQDAGSTDGTIEILQRFHARDSRVRWVSSPDQGPADAVNKAILRARGTVIGWLNSDDLYTKEAVERAVEALRRYPERLAVYGHGAHVDERGLEIAPYPTKLPPAGAASFLDGCFICQPTMLFRRSLFALLGPLDDTLRTAFDFEYWLRLFTLAPERVGFVDAVQAHSRLHADCITQRMRAEVALEGMAVLKRHLGRAPLHWALTHVSEIRSSAESGATEQLRIAQFAQQAEGLLTPDDARRLRHQCGRSVARAAVPQVNSAGFN